MQNALGDYSVSFPSAYYKIGILLKWNKIEEGGSYGGGPSIYIYILVRARAFHARSMFHSVLSATGVRDPALLSVSG